MLRNLKMLTNDYFYYVVSDVSPLMS